jgi:hypothetical protein
MVDLGRELLLTNKLQINETILLRLNKQRAAQLAERQVLEKNNETLKEMVGNLESMTLREKDRFATQLAELQELVINNAALKKKVESLEKVEKVNAELEVKLKGLEAEVQALKAQLGGISDTPKAVGYPISTDPRGHEAHIESLNTKSRVIIYRLMPSPGPPRLNAKIFPGSPNALHPPVGHLCISTSAPLADQPSSVDLHRV